jgi:hypothetical protein
MNYYEIKNQVEDEFGNIKQEFEVIEYHKLSNDEWIVYKRFESGRSYYAIEEQIYYSTGDNTLVKLNMDFNSKTCGACYTVGNQITNKRKITGNEVLFNHILSKEKKVGYSLHKQSYSDGTCFYTLQDMYGQWRSEHASNDLTDIIKQMEREIKEDEKLAQLYPNKDNPSIQKIFEELKTWRYNMIHGMKGLLLQTA